MELSHKKTLLSLIGVLAIVVVLVLILSQASMSQPNVTENTPATTTNVTQTSSLTNDEMQQKKNEIMSLVSGSKSLTDAQKKMIFDTISGDKAQQFNFTAEERSQIVKALNQPSAK